ncbi:MAG: N-acetylmuramoyl-L-alanine amidase [Sulfitobacter sp.]
MPTACPSPNCGPRRGGLTPTLVVLHYTAMNSAQAALERLCDASAEVSAHYLISGRGEVMQLVDEAARAWHAGVSAWQGHDDINSRSIGIELDNRGTHPFSEPQMVALEELLRGIMSRWQIAPEGVIGHSDIAPDRKFDPGPRFDWRRLERQGLAAAPSPRAYGAGDAEAFVRAAREAGFSADVDFDTLLSATRLRHAPWRTGPLCADDFTL